jgi:hypothetical protein
MKRANTYKNYPCRIIILSNTLYIFIYAAGACIISRLGAYWLILYLLFILWLELRVMRLGCTDCYYYGKYCAFGKGKIAALLFKNGNPNAFAKHKITWKDILPDFLVSIIPMIVGIVLLILKFGWLMLILIVLLAILISAGNRFVRGSLACKFCRQKKIGCPAERLFNKRKNKTKK